MQIRQHPHDEGPGRMGSPKETGRGERRVPHLRDMQEERCSVGESLRFARLRRGEDLSDAARTLRIRLEQLEALEDGRFEDLPGHTYVAGFLRSYARHLGLDPDAVLAQYRQESRPDVSASALYFPEPIKEARRPRTWIVALGLILVGVLYAAWYYGSAERRLAQDVSPLPDRLAGQSASLAPSTAPVPGGSSGSAAPQESLAPSAPTLVQNNSPPTGTPAPSAPPQSAVAPAGPDTASSGPLAPTGPQDTRQAFRQGEPAYEGTPKENALSYGHARGDTAIAAVGPRDWRNAPSADAQSESQSPTDSNYGPVASPPPGTAPADWGQTDRPGNPGVSSAPRLGNLINAARNGGRAEMSPAQSPSSGANGTGTPGQNAWSESGVREALATLPPVTLHANGATWVQIEGQDGAILLSRTLNPGESYRLPDQSGLVMTVGNAGGLDVEVNGTHTGPFGPVGAVRRHISIDHLRADAR